MNRVFITVLSLSISGSMMALILFAGKPLLKYRVSKAFAYYIWLLVLLRLVIPISTPINVVDTLFHIQQSNTETVEQTDAPTETEQTGGPQSGNSLNTRTASPEMPKNETADVQASAGTRHSHPIWNLMKNSFPWLWLFGFIIRFGWFMTAYACFSRRIRCSCAAPHPDDLKVFGQMTRDHRVRLACSSYVATPVLIGLIRPIIILPQFAYVHNAMDSELRNILRHELTHYHRKDILYKWLVMAITSLHWFNPLMPLICREVGKACELSCDEVVISRMSAGEKRQYGNTLLTFSAAKKLPAGILATTLSEGKAELKERLMSIMNYKKQSTRVLILTLMLTVLLTGCAVGLGAPKGASGTSAPASGTHSSLSRQPGNSDFLNDDDSSTQQSVFSQIAVQLDTEVPLMLPTGIPVAENHFLTATTVSQAEDYKVNFYETQQAVEINSQAASGGTLIASLEGTDYQDAESARESISAGYETVDFSSVNSNTIVDLGHQIKAEADVGLGHQILTWNEGPWCLHVDSPSDSTNQEQKYPDRKPLAEDVVAYLEDNTLPIPQEIGVVSMNIWNWDHDTVIEWQNQKTVYQITSQDPITALKIAVKIQTVEQKTQEYPDTKSISLTSEGVQYSEDFALFNKASLPFLTYVPQTDWTAEQTDNGVTITHKEDGLIKVLFLKSGIDQREAEKEFDDLLGGVSKYEKREDLPKWATSSYYLWHGSMTWAVLGLHSGQYFYIYTTHSDDIEGDLPLMQSIFNEWIWKDTHEALNYPLN